VRGIDFANVILSLAGEPGQVSPILGDLIEEGKGGWDLWISVCRITAARALQQIVESPSAVAWLALQAAFAEMGYLVGACLIAPVASVFCEFCFHVDLGDVTTDRIGYVAVNLFAPFLLGGWLARQGQSRAASGALALSLVHALALNLCGGSFFWAIRQISSMGGIGVPISGIGLVSLHGDLSGTFSLVATYLTLYPVMVLSGAAASRARQRNSAMI
jgi:hypothetical protein